MNTNKRTTRAKTKARAFRMRRQFNRGNTQPNTKIPEINSALNRMYVSMKAGYDVAIFNKEGDRIDVK